MSRIHLYLAGASGSATVAWSAFALAGLMTAPVAVAYVLVMVGITLLGTRL